MHRIGQSRYVEIPITTAEDAINCKLERYQLTNESSERQWDDVTRMFDLLGLDHRFGQAIECGTP